MFKKLLLMVVCGSLALSALGQNSSQPAPLQDAATTQPIVTQPSGSPITSPSIDTPPQLQPSIFVTNAFFSGPAVEAINFLLTSSNLMVAPYAIYDTGTKSAGGGVAAMYRISDYALTGMRLDYLNGKLWMPSMQLQLQLPVKIANKFTAIPFAVTGIATPIAGHGKDNGTAVGIFGIGMAIRINEKSGWAPNDIVVDYEKWTSFAGNQVRCGLLWKF